MLRLSVDLGTGVIFLLLCFSTRFSRVGQCINVSNGVDGDDDDDDVDGDDGECYGSSARNEE